MDIQINCADCNQPFTHSEGEQKFYAEKGFSPPKRCKACRQKRKDSRDVRGSRDD